MFKVFQEMRNKETKAHTLCYKKIHNFKNKNWKLKKKDTLIVFSFMIDQKKKPHM